MVWRRQQKECERGQEALSRVTSCLQQLVTSLGSPADSSFLREEMEETRRVAEQLCSGRGCWPVQRVHPVNPVQSVTQVSAGLSQRLVHLLSECDSASSASEDRRALERLWVLFLTALESLLSDLRTASALIGQFPLTLPRDRRSLVNTGQHIVWG